MAKTHRCGDLLLVRLAFSDQTGAKKRPIVVLRDVGNADILVVPVTSRKDRVVYDVLLVDWAEEGLKVPSVVRTEKLATLEKSAIVRTLGRLSARDWIAVQEQLVAVPSRDHPCLRSRAGYRFSRAFLLAHHSTKAHQLSSRPKGEKNHGRQ